MFFMWELKQDEIWKHREMPLFGEMNPTVINIWCLKNDWVSVIIIIINALPTNQQFVQKLIESSLATLITLFLFFLSPLSRIYLKLTNKTGFGSILIIKYMSYMNNLVYNRIKWKNFWHWQKSKQMLYRICLHSQTMLVYYHCLHWKNKRKTFVGLSFACVCVILSL